MVPIIDELILNQSITIASSGVALQYLKSRYKQLQFLELPDYNVQYPKNGSMTLSMFMQLPKLAKSIEQEHKVLKEYIKKNTVNLILSDNRYGIFHKEIRSVFIGHQLKIPAPLAPELVWKLHKKRIERFSECWIVDHEEYPGLAGNLSHDINLKIPHYYIGPLSQFYRSNIQVKPNPDYEYCVILSGPEPQRSLLEKRVIEQLSKLNCRSYIIRGTVKQPSQSFPENTEFIDLAQSQQLLDILSRSKVIVSRSGYTSIMDYYALGLQTVCLVPTPGQPEQEYLAKQLHQSDVADYQDQKHFDFSKIRKSKGFEKGCLKGEYLFKKRLEMLTT